jgi:hypothetical protein
MRRGGLIQGNLYDEAGEPLSDFYLNILTLYGDHASAMPPYPTDLNGSFSIRMPAGIYIIYTESVPGYVKEYYDDVYEITDATPVLVVEDGEVIGIDLFLQLAGTISGTVYSSEGTTPITEDRYLLSRLRVNMAMER